MIGAAPAKKTLHHATKHGLTTLKKAVQVLGGRAIDRRTSLGRALEDWRQNLLSDLGGQDQTSAQQRQIVDLAVKTKLILDSIDTWLLRQPSLVNHRKRMLLPVVLQRQQLADALARYMTQLGLEKKAKKILSLSDYLTKPHDTPVAETKTSDKPAPPEPDATTDTQIAVEPHSPHDPHPTQEAESCP